MDGVTEDFPIKLLKLQEKKRKMQSFKKTLKLNSLLLSSVGKPVSASSNCYDNKKEDEQTEDGKTINTSKYYSIYHF